IWTADFRRMESAYGEVKFRVGGLYVALPELLTLAMALALSLAAWAWLRHTYTGKAMRAIAEDAPIAAAFGVDVRGLSLLLSGLCGAFAGFAAAGLALSAVPFFGLPAFYESFLYLVLHWIVLAVSWNILSGYSGYFSFGHGAFFGAGMYTTATLATKAGVPFLWTLPAAGL